MPLLVFVWLLVLLADEVWTRSTRTHRTRTHDEGFHDSNWFKQMFIFMLSRFTLLLLISCFRPFQFHHHRPFSTAAPGARWDLRSLPELGAGAMGCRIECGAAELQTFSGEDDLCGSHGEDGWGCELSDQLESCKRPSPWQLRCGSLGCCCSSWWPPLCHFWRGLQRCRVTLHDSTSIW